MCFWRMEGVKRRLKEALLVDYSIKTIINLLEEEPSAKGMLMEVMDEMSRKARDECKIKLQWSILLLVQGSPRLQEMMAGIRDKCCNFEVYERIWNELVIEVNKCPHMDVFDTTDSPEEPQVYEAIEPCEAFKQGVAWWKQVEMMPCETAEKVPWWKQEEDDEEDLAVTTDEEENFWVHREGDWGDETVPMRKKRYRRMKAKAERQQKCKRMFEKTLPY